jgi:hypothetical protein
VFGAVTVKAADPLPVIPRVSTAETATVCEPVASAEISTVPAYVPGVAAVSVNVTTRLTPSTVVVNAPDERPTTVTAFLMSFKHA